MLWSRVWLKAAPWHDLLWTCLPVRRAVRCSVHCHAVDCIVWVTPLRVHIGVHGAAILPVFQVNLSLQTSNTNLTFSLEWIWVLLSKSQHTWSDVRYKYPKLHCCLITHRGGDCIFPLYAPASEPLGMHSCAGMLMGQHLSPSKVALHVVDPSNTRFVGATWVSHQTASRSVQPFSHSLPVCPTDTQTCRPCYSRQR